MVKHDSDIRASVEIYRPFFLAGILTVLTAGCLLGAIALMGIANRGNFTSSTWTPYIWAHANSQLYGWVGFFVMGFALQQHTTTESRSASFHRLAYLSLGQMGIGIVLRFVAEPLATVDPVRGVPLGVTACLFQLSAILLFHFNCGVNRFRTGEKLPWPTLFVFASLFWLTLIAFIEPYVFIKTHQMDANASIFFVAKWFAPYRELQFLGFVAMMIFGVASTKLHSCFGFQKPNVGWGISGFCLWSIGLIVRVLGWLKFFGSEMSTDASMQYRVSSTFLLLGVVAIAVSLGIFQPTNAMLRSQKFVRMAFAWLVIAGMLMLLEPFRLSLTGIPFSHAYTGAIRHAVTVGFISQMIIGVSLHVVAVMNDLDESRESNLWSVFWLLNIGNLIRVVGEIASDFSPVAFRIMGPSGFLELIGLIIWSIAISIPMLAKNRRVSPNEH